MLGHHADRCLEENHRLPHDIHELHARQVNDDRDPLRLPRLKDLPEVLHTIYVVLN